MVIPLFIGMFFTPINDKQQLVWEATTDGRIFRDGSIISSPTFSFVDKGLNGGCGVGATSNGGGLFNGDIAEIIIVSGVSTDDERQKIEGYLAWKWKIQSLLPIDHPYKLSQPGIL